MLNVARTSYKICKMKLQLIVMTLLMTSTFALHNSVRVRLIATANGQPASGIVEVMYNGVWGIVCDDQWDIRDARVVCRQLGYADATSALDSLVATPPRADFLLDNVECNGTESLIEQCSHAAWGQHNCGSSEVAGVICQYAQASTTFSQRDSCLAQGNFYCGYSRECIAMWRRCDGYPYCVYGEDESGCGTPTATYRPPSTAATHSDSCEDLGNFYCEYSRQCIERGRRCDGYSNCVYGEDESGCGYPSTAARPPPTTFSQRDSCLAQGNFYCEYSRQCITMWRRCDGYSNCNYGEDESGCGNPTTTSRPPSTTFSQRDSCVAQGNFYCEYSRECIAMWRRCDGYSHCVYGEDESGCGTPTITSRPPSTTFTQRDSCVAQGNFYCEYSRECIAMWRRCDGYSYCVYGEDESGCGTSTATSRQPASSSSCGGTLFYKDYVESPNYPSSYGNFLSCNWTLIAAYNGSIVLRFYAFSTESCCDFVSIYSSNGTLVYRHSGAIIPGTLVFGSPVVITFTTDYTGVSSGFSFDFTSSVASATTLSPRDSCERQGNFYCALSNDCAPMSARCNGYGYCKYNEDEAGCSTSARAVTTASASLCGGTLYGSGNVRSPNYPSNYGNYLSCNWTLIASPHNGNIVLYFDAFSTESCCDFTSIYHSNGTLINRYSGSYFPSSLALGSSVIITFTTDGTGVSDGFLIRFTTSDTSINSASQQPQGSFVAASGFAQAFLQLGKSSANDLPRGSWIVVSGYVTALLLALPRFCIP